MWHPVGRLGPCRLLGAWREGVRVHKRIMGNGRDWACSDRQIDTTNVTTASAPQGSNRHGQLSVDPASTVIAPVNSTDPLLDSVAGSLTPIEVEGYRFKALAAGFGYTCGLTDESALVCW